MDNGTPSEIVETVNVEPPVRVPGPVSNYWVDETRDHDTEIVQKAAGHVEQSSCSTINHIPVD